MERSQSIHRRLRRIRWTLLDARDRLIAHQRPSLRRWIAAVSLGITIHLISLPIYLTRYPQTNFARYARRRETTYTDSYARFKQIVQFTIGLVLVSIVAVTLAVVVGTVIRTKLFG
ncbi:MAG: hypothetical protein HY567_01650 [Candidatus Kerfeldbacteria bacterium]|nr:hypothetical protein [Candidatus Kerfeldbacteria bacterium]